METDQQEKKMWVICCEPRVVLCGWATEEQVNKKKPVLTDVRMCVFWDTPTGGPMGLAAIGPQAGCRITKAAPRAKISTKVEVRLECSEEAVKAWESEPWR